MSCELNGCRPELHPAHYTCKQCDENNQASTHFTHLLDNEGNTKKSGARSLYYFCTAEKEGGSCHYNEKVRQSGLRNKGRDDSEWTCFPFKVKTLIRFLDLSLDLQRMPTSPLFPLLKSPMRPQLCKLYSTLLSKIV